MVVLFLFFLSELNISSSKINHNQNKKIPWTKSHEKKMLQFDCKNTHTKKLLTFIAINVSNFSWNQKQSTDSIYFFFFSVAIHDALFMIVNKKLVCNGKKTIAFRNCIFIVISAFTGSEPVTKHSLFVSISRLYFAHEWNNWEFATAMNISNGSSHPKAKSNHSKVSHLSF